MLHLVHPALVHFSVAFLVSGAIVEIAGMLAEREAARRWGGSLLLAGLAALVPTIASGYLAANTVALGAGGAASLAYHELNGWIVLALAFASQFWKAWCGGRVPERARIAYVGLLAALAVATVCGAALGGRMVYLQGIGVR
jgi:uncharacterized membrane protein